MEDKQRSEAKVGMTSGQSQEISDQSGALNFPLQAVTPVRPRSTRSISTRLKVVIAAVLVVVAAGLGAAAYVVGQRSDDTAVNTRLSGGSERYEAQKVDLTGVYRTDSINLSASQSLSINGQLRTNNSLVLTPSDRPSQVSTGQIYYDKATNAPYIYDGNEFVPLSTGASMRTVGVGLMLQNGQLSLSQDIARALTGASAVGVTSLQGRTGDVSFTAGSGIAISGTTISSTGVRSIQAASPQLTVTSAGNGVFNIGTVGDLLSGTGTSGRIAVFSGLGGMADSLMSQSGGTISVDGNLAATGQIQTDSISAFTPGQGLTVSAGNDQIMLVSGGRTFLLPSSGPSTQTICTVGLNCASGGGGSYVLLQPTMVQEDTGSSSSISVNNTGGGNLLRLQGGGIDRLVVANDGSATLTGDLTVTGAINGATVNNANINGGTITGANINNASITGGSLTDTSVNGLTVTAAGISAAGSLALSSASNYDLMLNAPGSGKVFVGSSELQGTGALLVSAGGVDQDLTLSGSGIGQVAIMVPRFIGPNGATYSFDVTDPSGVSATICTSVGNCSGAAGIGGSGTAGTIAVFNGTGFTIGNSLLSQSAGTVTVTGDLAATNLQGNGGSITNLNAGNISVGTLGDGRLSNNVALYSSAVANFTGALRQNGSDVCTVAGNCAGTGAGLGGSGTAGTIAVFNGSGYSLTDSLLSQSAGTVTVAGDLVATNLQGNGSAVSNVNAALLGGQAGSYYLDASNISAGTLADGRLSVNVTVAGNSFNGANQLVQLNASGQLPAVSGALLTNLNANSITTGTLTDARLSGNVALFNAATANFTGALQQNGNDVCTTAGNCVGSGGGGALGGSGTAGTIAVFNGSGYTLANSLLSQSAGVVTVAGDLVAANLQGNGSAITDVNAAQLGGQAGSYYLNASNISAGTLANARLSSSVTLQGNTFNGANQLVQLNASGQLPAVSGALLTNLNASSLASGTIADGRLSANVALLNAATANFTGALQQNGNDVCTTAGNCVGSGGGGALGGNGTAGTIAVFNGSGFTLADSLLSQAGGIVSVGGLHTLSASGTNQDLTLQGTGTGRVAVKNPSFNNANGATYVFDAADGSGVNATICTTSGNCVGSGAGIGGNGTAGTIAVFNGSGYTLTNSLLSQSAGVVTIAGDLVATNLQGNGSAVINVNAAQLNGQAASYYLDASNINAGVLADARLSSSVTLQGNTFNGASQLVQLNASGQLPALSGALLTNLSASSIASGTLADGRLSANVALYNAATANFTGALQQNGNNVCTTAGNCVGTGSGAAIGGSGSANTLAMFNGSGYTIANSMVSQNGAGTVLTVSGQLTATAGAAINGNSTVIGTLTGLTGLTSSGTVTLSGLNSAGVVHTNASGVLSTSLITNADLQGGTYSAITGTGALGAGSIASGFGVISTGNNITTTATMQAGTINATSSLQTNGTQRITGTGGLTNITDYSQVSGNFSQGGPGSFSTGNGSVSLNGATSVSSSLAVAGVTTLQGGLIQSGVQFTNNGSTLNTALSLPDFTSSGSIGTAAGTVDRYTSIAIAQTTFGRTLTLPNPTTAAAGRVVYVFNTGTEGFTMNGITVPGGYGQIFLWNGTSWILGANGGSPGLALQAAYDGGNTINTTNGRSIAFTLTDTTTDADLITNIAAGSTGRFRIQNNGTDVLSIGSTGQLTLAAQGAAGGLAVGGDTLLYRSGVNRLQMSNALTIRNLSDTATALNVQTAAGVDVLRVDTANRLVAVGDTGALSARLSTGSAPDPWTSLASPESNGWRDVAYGNGLYVAVADTGTNRVMTSPDGATWTARAASEAANWKSIVYANGTFVAVANANGTGRVMTSPDGLTWTTRTAAEVSNSWSSVTYGNGLFVAVASGGTNRVMTSPDGITWTARAAAAANAWQEVTYGNGLFVAVAYGATNTVMTSTDGVTWTARTAAEPNQWASVAYGNGRFVAVANTGTNRVMSSTDGITWTPHLSAEPTQTWMGVTYGGGYFVAVSNAGTNRAMSSPDGTNWSSRTSNHSSLWNAVTYGDGLFVAVGTGRVMTATSQAAFQTAGRSSLGGDVSVAGNMQVTGRIGIKADDTQALRIQNSAGYDVLKVDSVNRRVTIGAVTNSDTSLYVSSYGAVWSVRTPVQANTWNSVAYGNGLFVAVASTGTNRVMTSPDGITWTARTASQANTWTSVTYGNGLFVAVSNDGTNRVMTSPDGITWTARAVDDAAWESVTYGGGRFIAVGTETGGGWGPTTITSLDGITWRAGALGANSWKDIAYGGGRFVAVAYDGTNRIATSMDGGATWTYSISGDAQSWSSVTYGNGMFVAVAAGSVVATSQDGVAWTLGNTGVSDFWSGVDYVGGVFIATGAGAGTSSMIASADGSATSWSVVSGTPGQLKAAAFGNGTLVAVGTSTVVTSASGTAFRSDGSAIFNAGAIVQGGLSADRLASRGSSNDALRVQDASGRDMLRVDTADRRVTVGAGLGSSSAKMYIESNIVSWRSQTAAQANGWTSVTYGNGLFVAVSNGGTDRVMTSPDGITWTARTASQANTWTSVTYGNGLFVAVSNDGTNRVMTSLDGITWTARTAAQANTWTSVTYGNGLFVAVAGNGTNRVMTSPDGITWTARTAPQTNQWTSVTYGNGLFVAVGLSGTNRVMTSPDGITWTARTASQTGGWISVTYGNGLFVAVANTNTDRIMTSPDGITWTVRTPPVGANWRSVTYGNGHFIAVADFSGQGIYNSGPDRSMASVDGVTWTTINTLSSQPWQSVTSGAGIFVTVGSAAVATGSFDLALRTQGSIESTGDIALGGKLSFGDAWTAQNADTSLYRSGVNRMRMDNALTLRNTTNSTSAFQVQAANGTDVLSVDSLNNRLVVGTYTAGTATRMYVGSDAVTWAAQTPAEGNNWGGAAYGGGQFVAVSANGTNRVMTSPNGTTWTSRAAAQANGWSSVTYGNGLFVAVSIDGTNRVMTSPNGITWTARTAAQANTWNSVTYGNGLFVAVAGSGTNRVMTSPDGITWTSRTAAEANQWSSVTYGNGLFVATGYNGTNRVMTSPDGITWTSRTVSLGQWNSVTYGGGLFVAVSDGGASRVMTSPDGITWTSRTAAEANQWSSVVYANGYYTAVANSGTNRIMTSPDGITWSPVANPVGHAYLGVAAGGGTFVAIGYGVVASANVSLALRAEGAIEAKGDMSLAGHLQGSSVTLTGNMVIGGMLSGSNATLNGTVSVAALDSTTVGSLAIGNVTATTINMGTSDTNRTINIGTGFASQAVTIGSRTGLSPTVIQSGSSGIVLHSADSVSFRTGGSSRDMFSVAPGGTLARLNTAGNFAFLNNSDGWILNVLEDGNIVTNWNTVLDVGGWATFGKGLAITGPTDSGYTTPGGYNLSTAINIQNYDLSGYETLVAMGVTAASDASARGILVADARTSSHQATIGILSPDESNIFGMSWDGSNTKARMKTLSGDIALQSGSTELASFGTSGITLSAPTQITSNSATAFNVQNSSNTSILSVDAPGLRVIVRNLQVIGDITIGGHIITSGTTPVVTNSCGGTITVTGTDTSGRIELTGIVGGCGGGTQVGRVTFATSFSQKPRVTMTPASAGAAAGNTFVMDTSTTAGYFSFSTQTALVSGSGPFIWYYHAIQ